MILPVGGKQESGARGRGKPDGGRGGKVVGRESLGRGV